MATIRRIGVVAANLLLAVQSLVVVSAGLAMLPMLSLWAPEDNAPEVWIEAVHTFQVKMTLAFLAVGTIVMVLHLPCTLRRKASTGGSRIAGSDMMLVCGLVVLPVWVIASSAPWVSLWRQGVVLLDSLDVWRTLERGADPLGFSVLLIAAVLLVPGLQLATAISFLVASVAVLLLMLAGTRHTTRVLIQCVIVQGAFLFATFQGIELFDRLSGTTQQLLTDAPDIQSTSAQVWIREKQEQAKLGASNLGWQFVGYLFLVPLSVLAASRSNDASVQPGLPGNDSSEGCPTGSAYQGISLASQEHHWHLSGEAAVEDDAVPELQHSEYVVRSNAPGVLTFLPGPHSYEISGRTFGADERVLFRTARRGGATHIEKLGGDSVVVVRPIGFLLPSVFEVLAANGHLLGTLRRDGSLRPRWLLLDDQGHHTGAVNPLELGIRYAKYRIELQGQTAGTLTWRLAGLFRPEIAVGFSPDQKLQLDRRFGLAVAVVMESKARFRAQLYNG